ncbi:hypothetical protein Ahy_B05g076262 isoform A [Arachis hypogaea]|uniref:No apical meristem-associated C-terminal domain-containing protein n=3 Tax=Arachis hypogaea TaxID=3818 RepID=A0A444Z2W9_ARAHY|nr:hypothetical protein Ahy_B05g076262 isoform A [Arachis hypogaea]
MLISAWLNVSTDPIVGTDQKGETFWSRIHSYCINKAVAQFAGCYDQASRNIRSGSNIDHIKELACKLYSTNYGQKFTFERYWNMLRLEQKWRSQLPTQSGGSKRTKVSATGAYSSSSNPETPLADEPSVDSVVRPQGSKKSKQKGKKKAQMSEDLSEKKSSVVKKLSLMENIKNVREKELMDRKKEREEKRKHRAKIMAIKEKELQIQAVMKEQELQTQRYIKKMEINVLDRYSVFDDILNDRASEVNYTINGNNYTIEYYLADGIYPEWVTFVKSISKPQGEKRKLFAQYQEGQRKDVERAFGVLQARFIIIRGPARF